MNFKEIRELIEIVSAEAAIEEIEVERSGVRVKIRRAGHGQLPGAVPPPPPSASRPVVPDGTSETPEERHAPADDADLVYVTSPMVGTFYRASSPGKEPFVSVGDVVDKGNVLCIIEAMKLMNEIEAETAGEIVGVFVENGHPVEYGERLFAIRPR